MRVLTNVEDKCCYSKETNSSKYARNNEYKNSYVTEKDSQKRGKTRSGKTRSGKTKRVDKANRPRLANKQSTKWGEGSSKRRLPKYEGKYMTPFQGENKIRGTILIMDFQCSSVC
ncbi:hypothetical protein POVCU1_001680 [Plasmodium ovale curtisi]|uniref:Uncharacterized protein n=1 Tax=Plasmodium ovale curtisi TaxID=864141 RepID=A0A1A8VLP5_PLAOA|nr:hypothetical protein POVCU1_001680 [Plasmodium ovale curtisi]